MEWKDNRRTRLTAGRRKRTEIRTKQKGTAGDGQEMEQKEAPRSTEYGIRDL